MHKDMKVNWCGGSQIQQVVWIMGSVGGGVRDVARSLAELDREGLPCTRRVFSRGLIYAGSHVESSRGARPEADRWLESSRCWAGWASGKAIEMGLKR